MSLLLIDKNKSRCKIIRDSLSGTPLGLNIESFQNIQDAVVWARHNTCDLVILEHDQNLSNIKSLGSNIPILILKNNNSELNMSLGNRVYDVIGPEIDRETLLLRIDNLLNLQLSHSKINQANDDFADDSRERYELAVSGSNDGVWDWDLQKDVVYYSKRWSEIIGFQEGDLAEVPASWLARVHPDDVTLLDTAIHTHILGTSDRISFEYRIRHKNGHYRWVLTRGQALYDEKGIPRRLVGSQTDISERKNSENQMAFNAFHDPLTGLANRALLMERLQQMVIRQKRDAGQQYAVLFLDIDKFKEINDNLGHEAGDHILKTVVQRLNICVREGDTLARLGGDEFVILVSGTDSEDDVIGLANRILQEMEKPIKVQNHDVCVGMSIGVVTHTSEYEDAESSVRDADLALYHAKAKGRNRFELFNSSMRMNTSKHFALQATLSGAKDRQELLLYYQPILSLKTGAIKGFEALMRWQHPENGFIYPLDFIPIAEETGLINEIGSWGMHQACRQLKEWHETIPGSKDWFMTVNVSGRQLENENLAKEVKQSLISSTLPSDKLIVEITESVLMHDIHQIEPKLSQLKDLGIKLAIDDFGTGYSSLAVLNDFPFDILKVAREFVTDIDSRVKSAKTVKLIQLLAAETHLTTIVEGIETAGELSAIQEVGCDLAQGYLFSKPKDSKTITDMLLSTPENTFAGGYIFSKKTA